MTNEQNNEYLQTWSEEYAKADKITANKYLIEDAPNDLDEPDLKAQYTLLNGSAAGTGENHFLDPVPFKNFFGKIYTDVIGKIGTSARTDSLKMNRDYMDYTLYDPEFDTATDEFEIGNTGHYYTGLNLLMPQYQRRVEVEDLDENFWVISTLLDAVIKALWGPYGLIDVVRKLIVKVIAIEKFLGLNNITGIELLHGGSNDLYFDMYSRFSLPELSLKLKTNSGERVIKNFIKANNKTSDRYGTTNLGVSRTELFDVIQAEILKNSSDFLYDSDLISSSTTIKKSGSKQGHYISLSTVIDAINNRLVSDEGEVVEGVYSTIYYDTQEGKLKDLLRLIDPGEDEKNMFTVEEIGKVKEDMNFNKTQNLFSISDNRLYKYSEIVDYILKLGDKDAKELYDEVIKITGTKKRKSENESYKGFLVDFLFDIKSLSVQIDYEAIIDAKNNESEKEKILKRANQRLDWINQEIDKYSVSYWGLIQNIGEISKYYNSLINELEGLLSIFDYDINEIEYCVRDFEELTENDWDNTNNSWRNEDFPFYSQPSANSIEIPKKFTDIKDIKSVEYRGDLHYNILIAKSLLFDETKGGPIKNLKEFREKYQFNNLKNGYVYDYFFDANGDTDIALRDAILVAQDLLPSASFRKTIPRVTQIRKELLDWSFLFSNSIKDKNGTPCLGIQFFIDLIPFNAKNYSAGDPVFEKVEFLKTVDNNSSATLKEEAVQKISESFFELIGINGKSLFDYKISFYQPTNNLLNLLYTLANESATDTGGYDVVPTDNSWLQETVNDAEYGLFGNIVIFLYDKQYYTYEKARNIDGTVVSGVEGLYIKSPSLYAEKEPKPFLSRQKLNENGILPLFIGRADLINGEIIQLRLTQKEHTQENKFGDTDVSPKMVNFKKLMNGEANFIDNDLEDEKYGKIFLSLYNSFADKLGQYNYRTALFFKDTTPFTSNYAKMPTSLDDWFRNGIICTYFRPKEIATEKGIKKEAIVKKEILKIHASMIAKNSPYVDNSFVSEVISDVSSKEPKTTSNTFVRKNTFTKQCAYFAAMRDNLIFYGSPPRNEYGQFVNSIGKMLCSPNMKPYVETIQTPKTYTHYPDPSSSRYNHWYCEDVLSDSGDRCTVNDIKDMLYRNATQDYPLNIEAIFGRRDVDNYIKRKDLYYIVVDREKGTRHSTNGPTTVGLSISEGFLHPSANAGDNSRLKSVREVGHDDGKIVWYKKDLNNEMSEAKNSNQTVQNDSGGSAKINNALDNDGLYGVYSVHKGLKEKYFADTFMIRFYSSAMQGNGTQCDNVTEFNIPVGFDEDNNPIYEPNRRPIFSTAYFFGINGSGKKGKDGSA